MEQFSLNKEVGVPVDASLEHVNKITERAGRAGKKLRDNVEQRTQQENKGWIRKTAEWFGGLERGRKLLLVSMLAMGTAIGGTNTAFADGGIELAPRDAVELTKLQQGGINDLNSIGKHGKQRIGESVVNEVNSDNLSLPSADDLTKPKSGGINYLNSNETRIGGRHTR